MHVVLHIGAPKTGTSFIQSVMGHNRDVLAERGVLWPGRVWSDQVRAVEDLRDAARGQIDVPARWNQMLAEIEAFDGSAAVISMEWLCLGDERMSQRAVDSLRDHDVSVVLTLRDLARAIPAQWQESTQNGHDWTYDEFVTGLTARRPYASRAGAHFWNNQDWARMARVWAPRVAPGAFSVVTVPPPGADTSVLWDRFCVAARIPGDDVSLDGWPNESLGAASAELMRRVQAARRSEPTGRRHRAALKHKLAKGTLAEHRKAERSLVLDPRWHDWVLRTTERQIAEVVAHEPIVVGDLDDLRPRGSVAPPRTVTDPSLLSDAEVLDAAIHGLLGLTRPRKPPAD